MCCVPKGAQSFGPLNGSSLDLWASRPAVSVRERESVCRSVSPLNHVHGQLLFNDGSVQQRVSVLKDSCTWKTQTKISSETVKVFVFWLWKRWTTIHSVGIYDYSCKEPATSCGNILDPTIVICQLTNVACAAKPATCPSSLLLVDLKTLQLMTNNMASLQYANVRWQLAWTKTFILCIF